MGRTHFLYKLSLPVLILQLAVLPSGVCWAGPQPHCLAPDSRDGLKGLTIAMSAKAILDTLQKLRAGSPDVSAPTSGEWAAFFKLAGNFLRCDPNMQVYVDPMGCIVLNNPKDPHGDIHRFLVLGVDAEGPADPLMRTLDRLILVGDHPLAEGYAIRSYRKRANSKALAAGEPTPDISREVQIACDVFLREPAQTSFAKFDPQSVRDASAIVFRKLAQDMAAPTQEEWLALRVAMSKLFQNDRLRILHDTQSGSVLFYDPLNPKGPLLRITGLDYQPHKDALASAEASYSEAVKGHMLQVYDLENPLLSSYRESIEKASEQGVLRLVSLPDNNAEIRAAASFGEAPTPAQRAELRSYLQGHMQAVIAADVPPTLRELVEDLESKGFHLASVPSNHPGNPQLLMFGSKETYGVFGGNYFFITRQALETLRDPAQEKLAREIAKAWRHEKAEMAELEHPAETGLQSQHDHYAHVLGLLAMLDDEDAIPTHFIEKLDFLIRQGNADAIERIANLTPEKIKRVQENPYFQKDETARFFAVNTARILKAYLLNAYSTIAEQSAVTLALFDVMREAMETQRRANVSGNADLARLAGNFLALSQNIFRKENMADRVSDSVLADYLRRNGCDVRVVRVEKPESEKLAYLKKIGHRFLTSDEERLLEEPGSFTDDIALARDVSLRAILEGKIRPVITINIKEIAQGDNFLTYVENVMTFAREKLNGNVDFVFSVEGAKQWPHDFPGMFNTAYRLIQLFGEDFFRETELSGIPDGGNKTRGMTLAAGFKAGQWDITADRNMMEASFLDMMARRLMVPQRNDWFFINGSDNVLKTVAMRLGYRVDSRGNLIPDASGNKQDNPLSGMSAKTDRAIFFGFGADILTPVDIEYLTSVLKSKMTAEKQRQFERTRDPRPYLKEILQEILDGGEREKEFMEEIGTQLADALTRIEREKLTQLGTFTNRDDGVIGAFIEKGRASQNLARVFLDGSINKNLFVLAMTKDFIISMLRFGEQHPLPDNVLPFEGAYSWYKAYSMTFDEGPAYDKELTARAKEFKSVPVYAEQIKKETQALAASTDPAVLEALAALKAGMIKKTPALATDPKVDEKVRNELGLQRWAENLARHPNFRAWFDKIREELDKVRGATIVPTIRVVDKTTGVAREEHSEWLDAGDVASDYEVIQQAYRESPDYFEGHDRSYAVFDGSHLEIPQHEDAHVSADRVVVRGGMRVITHPDTVLQNCIFEGPVGKILDLPPGIYTNVRINLKHGDIEFADRSGKVFIRNVLMDKDTQVLRYGADVDKPSEQDMRKKIVLYGDELYENHCVQNKAGDWVFVETRIPVTHDPKSMSIRDNIVNKNRVFKLLDKIGKPTLSIRNFSESTIEQLTDGNMEQFRRMVEIFPEIIYEEVTRLLKPSEVPTFEEFSRRVASRAVPTEQGGWRKWWVRKIEPLVAEKFRDAAFRSQRLSDLLIARFKAAHKDMFDRMPPNLDLSWYENPVLRGKRLEDMQAIARAHEMQRRILAHKAEIRSLLAPPAAMPAPAAKAPAVPPAAMPEQYRGVQATATHAYPSFDAQGNFYFGITFKNAQGDLVDIPNEDIVKYFPVTLHAAAGWGAAETWDDLPAELLKRDATTHQYEGIAAEFDQKGYKRFRIPAGSLTKFLQSAVRGSADITALGLRAKPRIALHGGQEAWPDMGERSPQNPLGDYLFDNEDLARLGVRLAPPTAMGGNPVLLQKQLADFADPTKRSLDAAGHIAAALSDYPDTSWQGMKKLLSGYVLREDPSNEYLPVILLGVSQALGKMNQEQRAAFFLAVQHVRSAGGWAARLPIMQLMDQVRQVADKTPVLVQTHSAHAGFGYRGDDAKFSPEIVKHLVAADAAAPETKPIYFSSDPKDSREAKVLAYLAEFMLAGNPRIEAFVPLRSQLRDFVDPEKRSLSAARHIAEALANMPSDAAIDILKENVFLTDAPQGSLPVILLGVAQGLSRMDAAQKNSFSQALEILRDELKGTANMPVVELLDAMRAASSGDKAVVVDTNVPPKAAGRIELPEGIMQHVRLPGAEAGQSRNFQPDEKMTSNVLAFLAESMLSREIARQKTTDGIKALMRKNIAEYLGNVPATEDNYAQLLKLLEALAPDMARMVMRDGATPASMKEDVNRLLERALRQQVGIWYGPTGKPLEPNLAKIAEDAAKLRPKVSIARKGPGPAALADDSKQKVFQKQLDAFIEEQSMEGARTIEQALRTAENRGQMLEAIRAYVLRPGKAKAYWPVIFRGLTVAFTNAGTRELFFNALLETQAADKTEPGIDKVLLNTEQGQLHYFLEQVRRAAKTESDVTVIPSMEEPALRVTVGGAEQQWLLPPVTEHLSMSTPLRRQYPEQRIAKADGMELKILEAMDATLRDQTQYEKTRNLLQPVLDELLANYLREGASLTAEEKNAIAQAMTMDRGNMAVILMEEGDTHARRLQKLVQLLNATLENHKQFGDLARYVDTGKLAADLVRRAAAPEKAPAPSAPPAGMGGDLTAFQSQLRDFENISKRSMDAAGSIAEMILTATDTQGVPNRAMMEKALRNWVLGPAGKKEHGPVVMAGVAQAIRAATPQLRELFFNTLNSIDAATLPEAQKPLFGLLKNIHDIAETQDKVKVILDTNAGSAKLRVEFKDREEQKPIAAGIAQHFAGPEASEARAAEIPAAYATEAEMLNFLAEAMLRKIEAESGASFAKYYASVTNRNDLVATPLDFELVAQDVNLKADGSLDTLRWSGRGIKKILDGLAAGQKLPVFGPYGAEVMKAAFRTGEGLSDQDLAKIQFIAATDMATVLSEAGLQSAPADKVRWLLKNQDAAPGSLLKQVQDAKYGYLLAEPGVSLLRMMTYIMEIDNLSDVAAYQQLINKLTGQKQTLDALQKAGLVPMAGNPFLIPPAHQTSAVSQEINAIQLSTIVKRSA